MFFRSMLVTPHHLPVRPPPHPLLTTPFHSEQLLHPLLSSILLKNVYKNSRKCGSPLWNVIPTMARNAEVSKQEENEEEEMREKQEEDGAWWFLIIDLTIVDIFLLNWVSAAIILINWCCSFAHPSIIDLTNSETHAKRFKNAQFTWNKADRLSRVQSRQTNWQTDRLNNDALKTDTV